ncbi:DUF554 domain-containing protein [Lacrimispora sp.]|uniref:DUF554 domain-containing protein n=1 Tax=Lacrimispora sp. TaxID=2719234 RepID=UPI00289EC959|nr:DUF554 domain-containing protein [Lacrimispora sp.]
MFFGPMFNAAMVVAGTVIGIVFKKYLKENVQDIVLKSLGLITVYIAISSMRAEANSMNVLISMAVGAFIGETIDLDGKFVKLGDLLQRKFASKDSEFASGFIGASLLFCMGSMSILGSLESGLLGKHDILMSKGLLDGIAAIFFSAQKGISVLFAAIVLLIYQGTLTLASSFLEPVLTETCYNQINVVGGIVLLTVAMNLLGIGKFKSMNLVPAIVVTVVLTICFHM